MSSTRSAIFTVRDFPFDLMQYVSAAKHNVGRPRYHVKKYADIIATFDIECTNLPDVKQSVMWHWQACVDGMVCVGRTWEEYQDFLKGVDEYLADDLCFVQYVHNLGY